MSSRISKGLISIIIASLLMGVVALPDSLKAGWPDSGPLSWFKSPRITLGLDLQGGTQLDYRIDLRNAIAKNEDDDPNNDMRITDVVEGVRTTIERRVNGLGVSEPQIYLSNVADEQHIIVELAGIKDVDEAKATVGKTIQLEFKEEMIEPDPDLRGKVEEEAKAVLAQVLEEGADFEAIGDLTKTIDGKIDFRPAKSEFESVLMPQYEEVLPNLEEGQIHPELVEGTDGIFLSGNNQIQERKGFYILKLLKKEVRERTKTEARLFEDIATSFEAEPESLTNKTREDFTPEVADAIWALEPAKATQPFEEDGQLAVYRLNTLLEPETRVHARHILISYEGAERAPDTVTRTKEEAKAKAEEVLAEALSSDRFPELAGIYSDGPSGPNGGDLGFFGKGQMTKAFEDAAFALADNEISDVVETEFGYHIIQTLERESDGIQKANVQKILVPLEKQEELEAQLAEMEPHEVTVDEMAYDFHEIYFDFTPDPWKATGLDGSHFKYATVTYGQLGDPQVSILFDAEGGDLFEKITERNIEKPLAIFVGGELISAPRVNDKISGGSAVITGNFTIPEALRLANDLNTGAIDAPVVLTGQYTISATLGESALKVSLIAGLIGLLVLAVYMVLYYRLMGIFAVIALVIYSLIILFVLKTTPIVMTLAGIAGIILSIGMAVDANILIFERTKEELNSGKSFSAAVTAGFERAWSSIRDSNVSSLITCAILWFFGNSIIRGFALMLAIGILISMFTAITITRKFLQTLTGTALSKNRFLLGAKKLEIVNR